MKRTRFYKIVALCLVAALVAAMPLPVSAQSNVVVDVFVKDDGWYSLNLLKSDNTWFVKAADIAKVAQVKIEHKGNTITFFKSAPACTLHTVKSDTYIKHGKSYYVPLQESSIKVGIKFHVGDKISAEVLRTPAQLKAEVCTIFTDERFQLSSITNSAAFGTTEGYARLYAILPFVGSGTFVGAITGKDEADRYRTMMTAIMGNSGSLSDFLTSCADIDGSAKKYADIISNANDISKKGGKVYNLLKSKGIDENILDLLAYEYNPYEHDLGDWLDNYVTTAEAIDIEYFLDVMAFYAAIEDMDESTLLAMKRVFENSENVYIQNAMKLAVNKRFGDESLAVADIYAGTAGNIVINLLSKNLEKYLSGGFDSMIGIGSTAFEVFVHPSDISEAVIYMSIGASIQREIQDYYWEHRNDSSKHITYDLRAIAIMHLKAAMLAYDYLAFDKDLADTLAVAAQTFNASLNNIFSYSESEYAPDYDNKEFCDYLDNLGGVSGPTIPSDSPTSPSDDPNHTNPDTESSILKVGDHILFGTASATEEPDTWQVIHIDGNYALLYNMCMSTGVFDASIHAETKTINLMRYHSYGSATWEYSDVRSWLNSRDESVSYLDISFDYSDAGIVTVPWLSDTIPSYSSTEGYLHSSRFTDEEYWIMQPVTHQNLIPPTESGGEGVYDKKFKDFQDEIKEFYQESFGISETTDTMFLLNAWEFREFVLQNDLWGYYYPNGKEFAAFWLRDSVNKDFAGFYHYFGTDILMVKQGNASSHIADERAAIRPACYIDMRYIASVAGSGTFDDPYHMTIDPAVVNREMEEYRVSVLSTTDGTPSEGLAISIHDGYCSVDGIGTCTDISVVIPSTYEGLPVTTISEAAFFNCVWIDCITLPDSITSVGEAAFSSCTSLVTINVAEDNPEMCAIDGVLYSKDMRTLLCYPMGRTDTSFDIPTSVTSIGGSAFRNCSHLTQITIPDSVTTIGAFAFLWCTGLKDVTIPDSVTRINDGAFQSCTSLADISIPNSVIDMGNAVFYGCIDLKTVVFPNSVTTIPELTFSYCTSLQRITIPVSVTEIGISAFAECTSLTSITFEGTIKQWHAINKPTGQYHWNKHVPATEVVCSDGVVDLS